jgi:uncharacterized protein YbjT (DUF2867 family)
MEGWLEKEGHFFKTWQRRWFVVEKHRVAYYDSEQKQNLKGTYVLDKESKIVPCPQKGKRKFVFALHAKGSGGEVLYMNASSQDEMEKWEAAINRAIKGENRVVSPAPAAAGIVDQKPSAIASEDTANPQNAAVEESPAPAAAAESKLESPAEAVAEVGKEQGSVVQEVEPEAPSEAPHAEFRDPVVVPDVIERDQSASASSVNIDKELTSAAHEPKVGFSAEAQETEVNESTEAPAIIPRRPRRDPASILVLGSTGSVGTATVAALSALGGNFTVTAGCRDVDSEKARQLGDLQNVDVTRADMSEPVGLATALQSADTVFLVTPGTDNKAQLIRDTVRACYEAGVGHIVVVSARSVPSKGVFADQFREVEECAVSSGIPYTILRAPFFLDNILGQLSLMTNIGQYFGPIPATALHNAVVVSDLGDAAARILVNAEKYAGRVLGLTGRLVSEAECAQAFSAALRRKVDYVQVPYEAAAQSMQNLGIPAWQVEGIVELYRMIEASDPLMCSSAPDLEDILGRPALSVAEFASRFQVPEPVVEAPTVPAEDPAPPVPAPAPLEEISAPVRTLRSPADPPVVFVLGASGSIGMSTLTNLSAMDGVRIKAGIRDPVHEKTKAISHLRHVQLVQADMSEVNNLTEALFDTDRLFIVTPGSEDRAELAINGIKAAIAAGVGYMVILSVMTVERPGTIFADQFSKIEAAAATSGIPHTIIRFPFFLDNVMGQLQLMMNIGQYFGTISPSKKHNSIAVSDAGEAVAKILRYPEQYVNRVLDLCGTLVSESETAVAFSVALDKNVTYVQVPEETLLSSLLSKGMQKWQADAIIEMFRMIEAEDGLLSTARGDLAQVLGRTPLTIGKFASSVELAESPKEIAVDSVVEAAAKENGEATEQKPIGEVVDPIFTSGRECC